MSLCDGSPQTSHSHFFSTNNTGAFIDIRKTATIRYDNGIDNTQTFYSYNTYFQFGMFLVADSQRSMLGWL